jgi:DNA-binding NtrC family response regulator
VANILSISYDETLLLTRQMLLEQMGHTVLSAEGFAQAYVHCESQDGKIDFIVLGHSIPHDDKVAMVNHCKELCTCRVLALLRPHEAAVPGAEKSVDSSDIEAFIAAIKEMSARSAPEKRKRPARRTNKRAT